MIFFTNLKKNLEIVEFLHINSLRLINNQTLRENYNQNQWELSQHNQELYLSLIQLCI